MRKTILSTALLVGILAACTNPKLEKITALKKEAIEIHDEVMPRMGEIHELSVEIKTLRNAMQDDTSMVSKQIDNQLADYLLRLDLADEAMMDWMSDYIIDFEKTNPEDSAIAYYTEQIEQIKRVKTKMDGSIDEAKKFVETFQE